MDERVEYTAYSIPQREARAPERASAPMQKDPAKAALSAGAEFAEITYDSTFSSASPFAAAQPIIRRAADPIREKFYHMRKLASGIPFARIDPGLFYKQAKFMEDFTDDYGGSASFFMYYPYYQLMGYEELRTYFTWRTKVRAGELPPTSLSYVFLFIYELLSGIGVKDPAEGLQKLMAVWNAFRGRALDRYLPGWLKDYHIYYELSHSFADFVSEHGLHKHYADRFPIDAEAEDSLTLWNGVSRYDITKSQFYAGNDALMRGGFAAVLGGLRELCASRDRRIEDLFIGHTGWSPWVPFQRALFHPWLRQSDRRIEIWREIYSCRDNRWTTRRSELNWDAKEIIGYIIKKTEACLRTATKYKYKITANPKTFHLPTQRLAALGVPLPALDAVIEKAVSDYQRNLTRTVIVVDHDNLNRIREEALGTQDKLVVPEDTAAETPEGIMKAPEGREIMLEGPSDLDGWATLKDALSQVERRALSMALRGADMMAYAAEHGVMIEVLADSINEKAADTIGDNIMEWTGSMIIYEEYREKVAKMVG